MTRAKAGLVLLLLTMGFIAGASAPFYRVRMEKPAEAKQGGRTQTEKPELAKHVRTDRYGDPMPPGAVTRLGSIRLRHGGHVMSVVFAPDGKTLVSGGFDGWAFLWGVATGKRLRVFRQDAIKSVAIDPAGKTAALASYSDGTVKLYELTTGKEVATFPGNRGGTESVDFSPDGKLLASASKDGKSICLWNVSNARQVWFSRANRRLWLPSLKFTPNGKYLICVDDEGALRYWDVATGGERKPPGLLTALRVYSFCFSADNKILATGGRDAAGSLQFWDAASGKEVRTIARTRMPMYGIVLAPGGKSVWTQSGSDDLLQWDVASGKQLVRLPHSLNDIRSFALSPDGKSLATGDHSGNVSLWDAKTGQKALNFEGHRGLATAAVFTPDGRQLWTGGNDFTIRLWSAASGEQLRQFSTQCGNDHVYDMALRPDGKMLAMAVIRRTSNSAAEKCDVRLWDLTTNTESKPLRGHGGWVYTVAFSPDGRTIASRSEDQTIRV